MRYVSILIWLAGCGASKGGAGSHTEPCAELLTTQRAAPKNPSAVRLTPFEQELVCPLLRDVRRGVAPFGEEAIGICEGEMTCDRFLGRDVGELPEGSYILKAELAVPNAGPPGMWTLTLDWVCNPPPGVGEDGPGSQGRTFELRYAGSTRGYRLMPLLAFQSPRSAGPQSCTWTLTAPHPDGDTVFEGSWSVPGVQ